ncbi:MAG: hypothetical protein ACRCZF_07645, partial [Gemmataceae bacterium]
MTTPVNPPPESCQDAVRTTAQRSTAIDGIKGVLVVGMILAHSIQLLGNGWWPFHVVSETVNLVAFPVFLFCFGFAIERAYYARPTIPWFRVLRLILRCWIAFALSSIAYFVLRGRLSIEGAILATLRLETLAPYSEFLVAFPLVLLVLVSARRLVILIVASLFGPLALGFLVLTMIALVPPPQGFHTLGSLIIRDADRVSFPVVEWLPMALMGVMSARRAMPKVLLGPALAAVVLFIGGTARGMAFQRFPLSAEWYACSLAVVIALAAALPTLHQLSFGKLLPLWGRSTLMLLVMSNTVLFAIPLFGVSTAFPPLGIIGLVVL